MAEVMAAPVGMEEHQAWWDRCVALAVSLAAGMAGEHWQPDRWQVSSIDESVKLPDKPPGEMRRDHVWPRKLTITIELEEL